jgi:hypothetical protein
VFFGNRECDILPDTAGSSGDEYFHSKAPFFLTLYTIFYEKSIYGISKINSLSYKPDAQI